MAVTNFLVKAVTQALLLSDVTAFYSFSADIKISLMPRSAPGSYIKKSEKITFELPVTNCMNLALSVWSKERSALQNHMICNEFA